MKRKLKAIILGCLFLFSTITNTISASSFTSVKVITSAHSRQCLDFSILPNPCIYMYLSCGIFSGCGIKYTARDRIRHKLPDLVVSAYRTPGDNPWTEIRMTESPIAVRYMQSVLSVFFGGRRFDGAGKENAHVGLGAVNNNKNLRYNEANVIGSPAAASIRHTMKYTVPFILGGPFLCKSNVTPFFPYHMSEYDAVAWRKPELDIISTGIDVATTGGTHIGTLSLTNLRGNTWGTVHPRSGFVYQTEPAKAAAVAVYRAHDVVSKAAQLPHVYRRYSYDGSRTISETSLADCSDNLGIKQRDPYCIMSLSLIPGWDDMSDTEKEIVRNSTCPVQCTTANNFIQQMIPSDTKSASWQMIIPKQSSSCEAFGSSDAKWAEDKNVEDGQYAWHYWQQYQCCKPGPGVLINP